jgi:3-oxoacyl-[acyl-carrier-protein] synthase-1
MKNVFYASGNILSPIGLNAKENFSQLKNTASGVREHCNSDFSINPFYASLFGKDDFSKATGTQSHCTKFEMLLISSIENALENTSINPADKKTVLIISSTKGNISLLEREPYSEDLNKRISLPTSSKLVADYFAFTNQPVIISHACISGLLAIITGMRMIQRGQYENVVIAGADVISKFVLSGFQSFLAISDDFCKPFDADRKGINLGEAAGTIILTSNAAYSQGIKVSGGSVSNDANHISGPSRTGEELSYAISKAMNDAGVSASDIDFISAHGTATLFNDEMEAKAISLAKLENVPVNSLKGYYGHTLGAAGIIESIVSIFSLLENVILPTKGFHQLGVTMPINVSNAFSYAPLQNCLKTASGFGGCNAAVIYSKQ